MFKTIFSVAFAGCAIISLLVGFLIGKKRKWQYSVSKMVCIVLATVATTFLTVFFSWLLSGICLALISKSTSDPTVNYAALSHSKEALQALLSMLMAPALFYILFPLCRAFANILKFPIAKLLMLITEKKEHSEEETEVSKKQRKQERKNSTRQSKATLPSSLCGAASGFLIFCVLCIPTVFGIANTAEIASHLTSVPPVVCEVANGAMDNAATKTLTLLGGRMVYDKITTYNVNGNPASLSSETEFVADIASAIREATKSSEAYDGAKSAQCLRASAKSFKNTTILPTIIPDFIVLASQSWDEGSDFIGVEKPVVGEEIAPVTDTVLDTLSSTDISNTKEDVATVLNVLADLSEAQPLASAISDPIEIFKNEETTKKVIKDLLDNDRLHVIVPTLTEIGIDMLSSAINMTTDTDALYDALNDELTSSISDALARQAATPAVLTADSTLPDLSGELQETIKDVLSNYGIEITDASSAVLALAFMEKFSDSSLSKDEVTDVLKSVPIVVVDANDNEKEIILFSKEIFSENTQIVRISDITINKDRANDTQLEAERLAKVFSHVFDLVSKASSESFNTASMVRSLGPLLDSIKSTHIFDNDDASILMHAILQSETVSDSIGVSATELRDIGNHFDQTSSNESYEVAFEGLAQTVEVVESITGDSSAEQNEQDIENLIQNLTPTTATTIQKLSTPSLMDSYGVPKKSSKPTSEFVSDIFGNLASSKENGTLTEEQFSAEAKAVSDLMNIALNSHSSTNGMFGSNSAMGVSANEFVNRIMGSTVVSGTLVDTVYGDSQKANINPLKLDVSLSSADKTELLSSMNNIYGQANANEKTDISKKLISIGSMIDLELRIANGAITEA